MPKDRVRLGLIGLGARGSELLRILLQIEGAEVAALCDPHPASLERAHALSASQTFMDHRELLDLDLDAVLIATPWELHVPIAVATMEAGKIALVEVPGAMTVEGAWELVETSERTGVPCMMLENVCYGREELMVLNMCRQGLFGELLHGEAAYIHDLRGQMHDVDHGTGSWRTHHYERRNGNLYPTHGLGPIAWYMNLGRGDRMDFLTSVSSPARVRKEYAKDHFPQRDFNFICGDINSTLVKTVRGRTILIQWDEQLPRPYSRHNLIQGTRGVWAGFPNRLAVEGQSEKWLEGEDLAPWFAKYDHPVWKSLEAEAIRCGGHGGMDFVMLWRIVACLRNDLPLDQDVYDAAAWSVIGPLSEDSVAHRGRSVDIPDFTRGRWESMIPVDLHPDLIPD